MTLTKNEKAIINSNEIKKEFEQKAYKPAYNPKKKYCNYRGRSGRVKKYTLTEIFLYKLKKATARNKYKYLKGDDNVTE